MEKSDKEHNHDHLRRENLTDKPDLRRTFGFGNIHYGFSLNEPCKQKTDYRKHKYNINHMGMKVTKNKGIRRKLMDGLIFHFRVIADVTCGIGEPVGTDFSALHSVNLGHYPLKDGIVHVSCNGNSYACNDSAHNRNGLSVVLMNTFSGFFLFHHGITKDVTYYGIRDAGGKSRKCHHHKVVAVACAHAGNPDKIGRDILSHIVVINALSGEPQIVGRHIFGFKYRRKVTVVHELFGSVGRCIKAL